MLHIVSKRLLSLVVYFAQTMSTYWRMTKTAVRFRKVLWAGSAYFEDERNAPEFKRLLIESGPVFIKLGQWMAQRPDVFPRHFIAHLESLQREAPQHSFAETRRIVEAALGARLDAAFEWFEQKPIASGSIAQVYRAHYQGRDVVVKVCHPNIARDVDRDLQLLRKLVAAGAAANNYHCKVVDVNRVTREMLAQCDMTHERKCIETIALNFAGNPLVHFPQPLFAAREILIETFVSGVDFSRIGDPAHDPFKYADDDEIAEAKALCKQVTMAAFLQMILHDALLHADLHRGNLLYHMERSKDDGRLIAHLTMLDLGIVVHLNDVQMDAVLQLIVGLYSVHPKTVVDALAKVAMQNNDFTSQVMDNFATDCGSLIMRIDGEQKARGGIDVAKVMDELLRLLHRHRLLVDGNLIRVMVDFILISEGRENKEDDNLTDDTIDWVLYGADGDHFPIVEHLVGIPMAVERRKMDAAGRVKRDDKKTQNMTVRSLSVARTTKYAQVESLGDALAMQNQSMMDAGSVLSKGTCRMPRKRTACKKDL